MLVDNGSRDPSRPRSAGDLPERPRDRERPVNLGFAGGCNLGIGDLDGVDYVALVNNDATVPPGLAEAARSRRWRWSRRSAPRARRSSSRAAYRELDGHARRRAGRGRGDPRDVGVRVTGVRVDGRDAWRDARFRERARGVPSSTRRHRVPVDGRGRARAASRRRATATSCELRLDAAGAGAGHRRVRATSRVTFTVGTDPAWYPVPFAGEPVRRREQRRHPSRRRRVRRGPGLARARRRPVRARRGRLRVVWRRGAAARRLPARRRDASTSASSSTPRTWSSRGAGCSAAGGTATSPRRSCATCTRRPRRATPATAALKERNRLLVLLRHGARAHRAGAAPLPARHRLLRPPRRRRAAARAGEPVRPGAGPVAPPAALRASSGSRRRCWRPGAADRAVRVPTGSPRLKEVRPGSIGARRLARGPRHRRAPARPGTGRSRMRHSRPPHRRPSSPPSPSSRPRSWPWSRRGAEPDRRPAPRSSPRNSDPDYATVEFSDPWDFSNAADFTVQGAQNLASYSRCANGVLDAHVEPGGGLIMAEDIAGAIPHEPQHRARTRSTRRRSARCRSGCGASTQRAPAASSGTRATTSSRAARTGSRTTVAAGWHDYAFDIPAQRDVPRQHPPVDGRDQGTALVPSGGHADPRLPRLPPRRPRPSASSAPPSPRRPAAGRRQPVGRRWLRLRDARPRRPVGHEPAATTSARPRTWRTASTRTCSTGSTAARTRRRALLAPARRRDRRQPVPPPDVQRLLRRPVRARRRARRRHGRAPDLADRGRARGVWQDSEDIVVYPGLEQRHPRPGDEPAGRDHRPEHAVPHRVGRPADHRGAVRPARGQRAAPVPRRQHQDRRGRDRLRRRVRHPVPRQRVARRHHRRHLHDADPGRLRRHADRLRHPGEPGRQHLPLGAEPGPERPHGSTSCCTGARTPPAPTPTARCA